MEDAAARDAEREALVLRVERAVQCVLKAAAQKKPRGSALTDTDSGTAELAEALAALLSFGLRPTAKQALLRALNSSAGTSDGPVDSVVLWARHSMNTRSLVAALRGLARTNTGTLLMYYQVWAAQAVPRTLLAVLQSCAALADLSFDMTMTSFAASAVVVNMRKSRKRKRRVTVCTVLDADDGERDSTDSTAPDERAPAQSIQQQVPVPGWVHQQEQTKEQKQEEQQEQKQEPVKEQEQEQERKQDQEQQQTQEQQQEQVLEKQEQEQEKQEQQEQVQEKQEQEQTQEQQEEKQVEEQEKQEQEQQEEHQQKEQYVSEQETKVPTDAAEQVKLDAAEKEEEQTKEETKPSEEKEAEEQEKVHEEQATETKEHEEQDEEQDKEKHKAPTETVKEEKPQRQPTPTHTTPLGDEEVDQEALREREAVMERTFVPFVNGSLIIAEYDQDDTNRTVSQIVEARLAASKQQQQQQEQEQKQEQPQQQQEDNDGTPPKGWAPRVTELHFYVPQKSTSEPRHACYLCRALLGSWGHFCRYTGRYFCDRCFGPGQRCAIPGRVVRQWDLSEQRVNEQSVRFLRSIAAEPVIDVAALNARLYDMVPLLQDVRLLRQKLGFLREYVECCPRRASSADGGSDECARALKQTPAYYTARESVELYSMRDLCDVHALLGRLLKVAQTWLAHVHACELCVQRGFFCEICRSDTPIYPYQLPDVAQCPACKAVYHRACLDAADVCPKCVRLVTRQLKSPHK